MKWPALIVSTSLAMLVTTAALSAVSDPTGKIELGVDISQAGTTAADRQKFVQSLSAAEQDKIRKACLVIVSQPSDRAPGVVAFCNDVNQMPVGASVAPVAAGNTFVTIPADALLSYNLIGLEVYNSAKEDVGEIKDLVIEKGKLSGYILSVGGFLGIGEHYVAVDPSAVSVTYDQANAKWLASANVTKDEMKSASEFKYEGKFKH